MGILVVISISVGLKGGGGCTPGLSPQIVSCAICAEVLSLKIKQCHLITGISILDNEIKILHFANETIVSWMVPLSPYKKYVNVFLVVLLLAILKYRPASELTMISLRSFSHFP